MMRFLSLLTDQQIIRLALRLERRIGTDVYGWDWPTLWVNNPGLAKDFKMVLAEYYKRRSARSIPT